ncbi:MAG: sigma-70 family RNA polymerase sigma factor [Nitrososphaera sp.]|nr:sigma-70 family RNA polymerase sigma factor [Nitrososphaera sp.]MCI0706180.1 sigma-70 family RNA polymerase sigma factor [Ignavibacteriota bacterium]
MVDEDISIVQRAVEGDNAAFGRLVEKYQRLVFNLALNMSRNYDDAADITQSVFLKVYEKLGSFDPKYKFFSWLYRIAVNESLNLVQKQGRMEELDEETASDLPTPDGTAESGDVTQGVQEALLELDLNYRIVIVLKHFQDLSYEEIAVILDIPEKLVKSRLFTARTMLRTICKQRGIG